MQTIYDVTSFLFTPVGIALHGSLLYVADSGDGSVNEYLSSDNGDVSPTNVITGLSFPEGVAVDGQGRIYVTDRDSIVVYAANATGHATPLRTISGSNTLMNGAVGLTVARSVIAVANGSGKSVTIFKEGAKGNVSPLRVVTGSNTGLVSPSDAGIQ
jgi:sugar lactone lactonase YvrE